MKTKRLPFYKKKINEQELVKDTIKDYFTFTEEEFFWMEIDMGITLLDLYFEDMPHPVLVDHYRHCLLKETEHGFWPWFINQKRMIDARFVRELEQSRFALVMLEKQDYIQELGQWMRLLATHDKLRHFIMQSPTLFIYK